MLKKTLIGFAVLLVAIVAGALVAPSFIDWNARLPEITAGVKNATGRDLVVDGRLEVRLLPAPMLTARGVKLGNAPGATAPYMATLDAVEVRVALMPLLSGQVQVERIRLVKPQVYIEMLEDGRTNLEFEAAPSTTSKAKPSGGSKAGGGEDASGMGVRLDNFEIIDATVIYQDAAKGTMERVEGLNTTLRAASLQGPFEAQGEARLRGVPLTFEASLGQIIAGRTIPINALVKAPGGTRVQIGGAVLEMEIAPRFKGKVKVEGANLAALLNAVTGAADADGAAALLNQTFGLETTINATASEVMLDALELNFGATRATGQIDLAMADGTTFNVDLKATRIDADALLGTGPGRKPGASNARSGGAIAPQPPKNGGADGAHGFTLPRDVNGTVALRVDAVTFKGDMLHDIRLNAELIDGELTLSQFQLQAPGVTDVALFGFVKPEAGQPRFNGDLEIVTANPKGLTDWLGVKMPDAVAGRVKRVTFKTQVAADRSQVVLSGIDLTGDRTRVTGGVTVALRARPSFGADLSVDALNLDTYTNGNGNGTRNAKSAMPTGEAKSQLAQAMDLAGMWAATSVLNDFDANLKLRLGSLTQDGRTLKDLLFDGTLYAGTLELRQLKLGDLLGASANVKGSFNGFGGVPEMTGVRVKTKIKNANALATALGVTGLPAKIGAVTLNARAEGSLLKPKLNVNVGALDGDFSVAGRMSFLPIGFGWDGKVSAKHPDAVKLLTRVGYAPAGPLGALDVKANVKTDGATHTVTALRGKIGETKLAGQITAKTGGAKPNVVADLTTGVLDIQRFLAKSDKRADAGRVNEYANDNVRNPLLVLASTRTPVQVAQASSRADKRWSREAFDLSVLDTLDGELTLKSDAIQFGDYRLNKADIHATLNGGVMIVDRLVGRLFGGPVSGTAIVRASGRPTVESTLKLNAMNVGRAVKAVAGKNLATGKLGLNLNFDATGLSPANLVSSLNGAGSLKINALDVKKGGTGTALAPVIGLVAAMNQFSLGGAGKPKGGMADLSLNFDLKDGVANARNLVLNSSFGSGTGSGSVDLAAWAIDFAGTITVEPNLLTSLLSKGQIGKQEVPFSLTGALDKPGVKLGVRPAGAAPGVSGDPLQGILNQVLPGLIPQAKPKPKPAPKPAPQKQDGTLAPPPPQQKQAPSSGGQRPLTPEEMIKQLMKGL